MIEAGLAKKFIEQVTQYTEYNINIMNEQGVIIASRDPKRVGSFHEVAYYIVTGNDDMVVTSAAGEYHGVKPGINMVINIDGRREGVVGITGDPKEIKSVALITKMAIEAMLKYEKQQEELRRRRTKKEYFTNLLIHVQYQDSGELWGIAKQLNYSENIIRIPILCRLEDMEAEAFLATIKNGANHKKEDISILVDSSHVLIFKTMPKKSSDIFGDYKYIIGEYLSTALQWLRQQEKSCKFYIGTFQESFTQYYNAYRHCKWLEENAEVFGSSAFFYDYAGDYIRSVVPMNELQWMFNVYKREMDDKFKKSFMEITGALIRTNYNLAAASKELFMHKNTLLYRYNKVKEALNINPLESSSDRSFMEAFYIFLRREH